MKPSSQPATCTLKILSAAAGFLLALPALVGCGLGAAATAVPVDTSAAHQVGGLLRGGEQAISGATVKIYSTKNNGVATNGTYLGTATLIDTTMTLSDGTFKFTDGPTCSDPDQVYFVASGGNAGSFSANNNILLMAAIGNCDQLNTQLFVDIDEVTTVAAAYALNSFTSISGSTVNVTSSSTNYAGTLNSGVYTGTPSNAAGLAHAFLNANNLANYSDGTANTTVPGNTGSVVPAAVINSLADVMEVCVNSPGGAATSGSTSLLTSTPTTPTASVGSSFTFTFNNSVDTASGSIIIQIGSGTATKTTVPQGTTPTALATLINTAYPTLSAVNTSAMVITVTGPTGTANTLTVTSSAATDENNDGTTCGRFFGAATPLGGTPPTNTLQAMMNIARAPALNAANIFSMVPGTGKAFSPTVTNVALDWMLSISYATNTTDIGQTTGLYDYPITLDANDNVYTAVVYPAIGSTTSASCLAALSSNGVLLSGSGWDCLTTSSSPHQLAADQNGFIWVANQYTSVNNLLEKVSATDGTRKAQYSPAESATHTVQSVAVDKNSNVFYSSAGSSGSLSGITYSGGTYSAPAAKSTGTAWDNSLNIAIDGNGNVWGAAASARSVVVYNPTNNNTANYTPTTAYTVAYGVSFDSNGNGWVPHDLNSLTPFTYTANATTPSVVVASSGVTSVTDTTNLKKNGFSAADGTGTIWIAEQSVNNSLPGVAAYKPSTDASTLVPSMPGAVANYAGCALAVSGDCNGSAAHPLSAPWYVAVDATGSLWVSGGKNVPNGNTDHIVQILGLAAPAWPLLATGKPGVMP